MQGAVVHNNYIKCSILLYMGYNSILNKLPMDLKFIGEMGARPYTSSKALY